MTIIIYFVKVRMVRAFLSKKELYFIEKGIGQPIIFIHGTLSDFREWQFQIDKFAQNYHVISYSRGYAYPNQWIGNGDDNTIPNNVADLAELIIKRLNLGPAHVIGHSYGAFIALCLAFIMLRNNSRSRYERQTIPL